MNNDDFEYDNISYIQRLNRIVLKEAEKAITEELPGDGIAPAIRGDDNTVPAPSAEQLSVESEKRKILKRRNRMWGLRNPIVWMLEKITDTELKIEKQRPSKIMNANDAPTLDEKDVAIVKHFAERQAHYIDEGAE